MIEAIPGADVSYDDSLVDYTSNLSAPFAGLSGLSETEKERLVREAQEIVAGKRESFTYNQTEVDAAEYRASLTGAIASSIFAALAVPSLLTPRGGLPPTTHIVAAAVAGWFLGYQYPVVTTSVSGGLLLWQAFDL